MRAEKHCGNIIVWLRVVAVVVIFLLVPLNSWAQEGQEMWGAQEERAIVNIKEKKAMEVSVGWGYSPSYSMIELHMYDRYYPDRVDLTEMLPVSDKYALNPITVEITKPLSKRWDVGGSVTYNQTWQRFAEGSVASYYFTAEALLRFNIVKRDAFRVYASASCGPFLATRVERTDNPSRYTEAVFIPSDLYLGISGGRRIFGFCELGFGTKGTLRGGIGYRFNTVAP